MAWAIDDFPEAVGTIRAACPDTSDGGDGDAGLVGGDVHDLAQLALQVVRRRGRDLDVGVGPGTDRCGRREVDELC